MNKVINLLSKIITLTISNLLEEGGFLAIRLQTDMVKNKTPNCKKHNIFLHSKLKMNILTAICKN